MPILYAFEHAPVRLKLPVYGREHAVNRKLRTIPRDLSHHGICRVVWERGAWLFLKRWGALTRNGGDRKTQLSRSLASVAVGGGEN